MGRTAGAAELTIDKAVDLPVEELARRGVYVHRRLGEALEEVGHAPWITEQDKTAFLTSEYMRRAEVLHSQLLAYSQIGPRATLKQKDVRQNTPIDILGQRIKDLEGAIAGLKETHKGELERRELTIESLRGHKLALEGQIKALEEKVTLVTKEHEVMRVWAAEHMDDFALLDEQNDELKEIVRKLAHLI